MPLPPASPPSDGVLPQERLNDFRGKRVLGLGNVFGEQYLEGLESPDGDIDRSKELKVLPCPLHALCSATRKICKVADALLMPHFEIFFTQSSEFDKLPARTQAAAAALATVVKAFMSLRPSCHLQEKLLDR